MLLLFWLFGCTDPALIPCDNIDGSLEGLVVDMEGRPIVGATLRVGWSESTTDEQGRFWTPKNPGSRWIQASAEGFSSRSRPGVPGDAVRIRLRKTSPGEISLTFGGDVMAGRRFLEGDNPILEQKSMSTDLWKTLEGIAPLLAEADLTSINLEGPLLLDGETNPNQDEGWSNPPELGQVLAQSGVDIVNLANNHTNDLLDAGISATIGRVNNAELIPLGAGLNYQDAWKPYSALIDGWPIAMISCSLLYEAENAPSDAASIDKSGVAGCTIDDLRAAIIEARYESEFIIVQIHGGVGYTDSPSYSMRQMVLTAGEAGAHLIIGHGPHVLQGVNETEGAFVAWSLGNLLFDQELWATLPTGLINVVAEAETGEILRATFEPMVIQDYIPTPIRGKIQENIAREFAGRSGLPAVIDDGAVEFDLSGLSTVSRTLTERSHTGGWSAPEDLNGAYVSDPLIEGRARIGRDLLLGIGDFEDVDADASCGEPLLWNTADPRAEMHGDAKETGLFGIRHKVTRYSTDSARSRPQHRIPVGTESAITLTGSIQGDGPGEIELRFYTDTSSEAFGSETVTIPSGETWSVFQVETSLPEGTTHILPFIGAKAEGKRATVDFDNFKLIVWTADFETQPSRYDQLQVDGSIQFQLSRRIFPGMASPTEPELQ